MMRVVRKPLKYMSRSVILVCGLFTLIANVSIAQNKQLVDGVIAIVGKKPILKSEVAKQMAQYRMSAPDIELDDCKIFQELLFQKLLVAQADKDSVTVPDEQVDNELNRRMRYFVGQLGSEEKLEQYYGKKITQLKEELRPEIHDVLLAQTMQQKAVGQVAVSPNEVRAFYENLKKDTLPLINSEMELAQLVVKPYVSPNAKIEAREKIAGLRQRVVNGESMAAISALYTEDPGSVKTGGRYESIARGTFVPEFEAVAFRLKSNEVSEVFETSFGFHFIQLLERKGEVLDLRHLLIAPKISGLDIAYGKNKIDSVYEAIKSGNISFADAVKKFSQDDDTKNNGGAMVNPASGNTKFETEEIGQMDPNLVFTLDQMKVGDISKPTLFTLPDSKQAYRILYLKSRSLPHEINPKEDYQRLQNMATEQKQKMRVEKWTKSKLKSIYVRVSKDWNDKCDLGKDWEAVVQ
jgi:peptidyl-prolyl cis-trans isomerase SurA